MNEAKRQGWVTQHAVTTRLSALRTAERRVYQLTPTGTTALSTAKGRSSQILNAIQAAERDGPGGYADEAVIHATAFPQVASRYAIRYELKKLQQRGWLMAGRTVRQVQVVQLTAAGQTVAQQIHLAHGESIGRVTVWPRPDEVVHHLLLVAAATQVLVEHHGTLVQLYGDIELRRAQRQGRARIKGQRVEAIPDGCLLYRDTRSADLDTPPEQRQHLEVLVSEYTNAVLAAKFAAPFATYTRFFATTPIVYARSRRMTGHHLTILPQRSVGAARSTRSSVTGLYTTISPDSSQSTLTSTALGAPSTQSVPQTSDGSFSTPGPSDAAEVSSIQPPASERERFSQNAKIILRTVEEYQLLSTQQVVAHLLLNTQRRSRSRCYASLALLVRRGYLSRGEIRGRIQPSPTVSLTPFGAALVSSGSEGLDPPSHWTAEERDPEWLLQRAEVLITRLAEGWQRVPRSQQFPRLREAALAWHGTRSPDRWWQVEQATGPTEFSLPMLWHPVQQTVRFLLAVRDRGTFRTALFALPPLGIFAPLHFELVCSHPEFTTAASDTVLAWGRSRQLEVVTHTVTHFRHRLPSSPIATSLRGTKYCPATA